MILDAKPSERISPFSSEESFPGKNRTDEGSNDGISEGADDFDDDGSAEGSAEGNWIGPSDGLGVGLSDKKVGPGVSGKREGAVVSTFALSSSLEALLERSCNNIDAKIAQTDIPKTEINRKKTLAGRRL